MSFIFNGLNISTLLAIFILSRIFWSSIAATIIELNNSDPKFSGPIQNVTVPVGRDAVLTCVVHELMAFKVAWLRVDTQTILSIQNHVITKNHRIGISHTEHRIWQLKIREVRETDRGWYMCQINTDPMKSQVGYLDVVVPPDIIDYQTSHDMVVAEGQNISLICTATGLPMPNITWKREKDQPIMSQSDGHAIYSVEGPRLTLYEVSRANRGAYMCIASNGVPPTVSKRIQLVVNFAPTIWTRYDLIYAGYGQKLTLECISESHPTSVNFWVKDKEFLQGGTYETVTMDNVFKIVMRLTIRPLKTKDFGDYRCIAKNLLGETDCTITIHHKAKKDIQTTHQASGHSSNQLILIEEYIASAGPSTWRRISLLLRKFILSTILLCKFAN